jgi:predicted amidophosphoribosyltransferase
MKKENAGQKNLCRKCKTAYHSVNGLPCPVCSGIKRDPEPAVAVGAVEEALKEMVGEDYEGD